ncbi:uncharacterized protein LOC127508489 isoform X10 [Ctenopharyngodon idella]|uniref:uncharacterized protein LOC127508489 isoform X10 n=1 Tax=Ctenopharyngodon idella TaxID=7959 RepID=UPI00222EE024|nr:uncharacterized protein LOC127508489 isoform X10 [Ctenopharyngodon idella]
MACAQQCAAEYLRNCRRNLVTQMRNLPLIIENLYQQKVFNDHEVDALKAERTEFDKARSILDWVINKGETACYELLRILDATQKRTLDSDLHYWICCFPFRVEDTEISYSTGTKPCQNYQKKLKNKAKNILKDQREHCGKYLGDEGQVNFHFISLVLETDSEGKTPQCKIKWKNKKCKKLRPKKLRAYIPNEEQALSPVDLLRCQDKNILLIGKPGIGKTTVVQEIMRLWAEKDDREFYYMFYFDESVLAHSSRVVNLESIFFDVYLKPKEKDRKDVFQDIEENSENVVIVFDGVVDLEENSTLRKIMKHELLPDAKIIITCRSEVEYDPLFSSWPTRKVYVQGFSEKSISTYYQSMLGHDSVLLDDVLKNQELFSLSHVPMYAFMIVDLIQFKNDNVYNHLHTVTEMYIHIFRVAVKKHGKKKIEEIDMYLKEIKDQIHLLMKNAFSATMQKCLNLPDISSVKKDICHAFLKMITTRDSPTSATTYCAFLHNTMQEFFSALWLLGNPGETEKVLHLCQTEENKHMRHVLPFLCGLLGEHNINLIKCLFPEDQIKKTSDWFIEKFLDTFLQPQSESEVVDLLYVCQCLYELQSPKACLMFLEKMDHQLEPEGDLDPHQCCALSYVIGQSRDKEVYLNLEDCNMTDTGMKMMLRCSPKIRLKIWEDPLKQITFFLEFFHKVSQCSCSFFDLRPRNKPELCDALLDLCSHVKNYETQTGWSFLPVLQSVFQSPDVWIIDLSQRKTSVLLEVLKLQTEKKPVELRGCSEEESEMKSFLQCLPYISQLRIDYQNRGQAEQFVLKLFIKAGETETQTGEQMLKLLTSVYTYRSFPYEETDRIKQSDLLLDLYSHVKNYETQTGSSFLPALQSVFQSPDVWIIDLSQRKTSVLLEVLKLQTEKKPVELRRCSEEESEMMSFLQCLPYISQLRFSSLRKSVQMQFLLKLFIKAAETETQTGEQMMKLLTSVCTYRSFPYGETDGIKQRDFLLGLYSHVNNYKTQTGRSFLPALQSVFQSPDVWIIDLSQRKTSVLLEVLKLQTEKKPVDLRGCSEEESEIMSFLQCLPYISQLRFSSRSESVHMDFVLKLFIKAAETETQTGEQMLKLLTSVCTYSSFPYGWTDRIKQRDFLLDLCSHVKNYETQTGGSFLPALQSVFQSPDVWIIDLSQRKTSVLLEVLKLQTEKKPVELRGCSEEESEMMSFLQCLPYISQLRIHYKNRGQAEQFLLKLFNKAAETETQTGEQMLKLLTSVCTYSSFPYEKTDRNKQRDFLLDLCSHVKKYETQTALQSVFQSPDVWIIDLSKRKTSVLLKALKLQTVKKPVELRGCLEEEREMMSLLHCLPYISQLRFSISVQNRFILKVFIKAAAFEKQTGKQMLKLLASVCTYSSFPYERTYRIKQRDLLLDLYSHVKNYETQTGRSFLPALQSVFQLPDVWIIDLSQRKTSVLLEVLKLQTEKKPVKLRGCSEEESEMSFLQCLPYISQLRIDNRNIRLAEQFVLKLFIKAAETEIQTGEQMLKLLTSVCTYSSFPYERTYRIKQSDFLLDLYSHVKNYETQTGRSFLPALQSVFQLPDDWIIDLSQRKTSVLLEVLKLQTEKKPVELRGCSEEESEVRSFLQCLPYISQLRFTNVSESVQKRFHLKLLIKAAETETQTGEQMLKLLTSVCAYRSFPYQWTDRIKQRDFLLDLCSHVKNYETQTGGSFLPALQSVFQSPKVWIIDLSQRKTSVLLEVLKLQTEKKPVELRGCSEEESEMKSFLQCLPHISQLSCSERCLLTLVKVVQLRENPDLVTLLLEVLDFSFSLEGSLSSKICRSVGRVLRSSADRLNLTLKPEAISIRGTRLLFRHITHIHTLRLSGYMVVRIVQALRSMRVQTPVTVNELTLDPNDNQLSERKWSRVLSSLAILLRLWTVQCLNLTEYKMESVSLSVLLCHQGPLILRSSKESLQKLVECVCEAQEEELTQHFLQKVGGDLTSCSLSWEELHYFLQHKIQQITVDFRKSNIQCKIREILPFLNRIQFKRLSSSFMLSIMREIYESGSAGFVSSLLSSVKNYISLQSRELDSVHCAALRFTLQHCTAVSLNLLWTSIPEEELESIVPLFRHVSSLSVDRRLLLKMLHCCSVSDVQQEAAAVLLSVLQHKLDFCRSALDLTTNTDSEPLHLTTEDCRVMSTVIQRAHTHTQLIMQDCVINTAGMDQLFPVLRSVKLCCDKSLLLQFLAHVRPEEAVSLSRALGDEVDLSQTHLEPQVCRGLVLILEYSEGLTELDLSQCRLTDHSLDLLLPNLHKAQNIDFSGNSITDIGAQRIYSIVSDNSNIKTVRLFNNRIEFRQLFLTDPRFEIW